MANGEVTRALIECLDGDFIDTNKFFRLHPLTDSLRLDLVMLENLGYISLDYGDNIVTNIAVGRKFKELIKVDQ